MWASESSGPEHQYVWESHQTGTQVWETQDSIGQAQDRHQVSYSTVTLAPRHDNKYVSKQHLIIKLRNHVLYCKIC